MKKISYLLLTPSLISFISSGYSTTIEEDLGNLGVTLSQDHSLSKEENNTLFQNSEKNNIDPVVQDQSLLVEVCKPRKYLFSELKIDKQKWLRHYLMHPETKDRLVSLLEIQSQKGDEEAQIWLFQLRSQQVGTINIVEKSKALELLELGLQSDLRWAHTVIVNDQSFIDFPQKRKIHSRLFLAVRGDKSQEMILDNELKYEPSQVKDFVKNYNEERKEKKKNKLLRDFINEWKEKGYYKPLVDAATGFILATLRHGVQNTRINYEASQMMKCAAELNHIPSLRTLILEAVKQKDNDSHLKYGKRLAKLQPDVNLLNFIGRIYLKEGKIKKAHHYFCQAANMGNIEAMGAIGDICFDKSIDPPAPLKEAIKYTREAAKQGDLDSIRNLAMLLREGFEGQEPDLEEAFNWYLKGAAKNDAKCIYHIGYFYDHGLIGQDSNPKEALKWYLKNVDQKHVDSMFNAARLYYHGFEGQPKDKEKALELYRLAAEEGDVESTHCAALILLQNLKHMPYSAKRNEILDEVLSLLTNAAKQGYSPAMVELGIACLENNIDLEIAMFWFERAAALGDSSAQFFLETIEKEKNELEMDQKFTKALQDIEVKALKSREDLRASLVAIDPKVDSIVNVTKENPSLHIEAEMCSKDKEIVHAQPEEAQITVVNNKEEESLLSVPVPSDNLSHNPKRLRELLRQAGLAMKNRKEAIQQAPKVIHDNDAKDTAYMILSSFKSDKITKEKLDRLFQDSYFSGQVKVKETKSGLQVEVHHILKNEYLTTGTHKNHNNTYKGFHRNFIVALKEILALFDVTEDMISK